MSRCPGCDVKEGQLHDLYCELERCPFCCGQLASCDCPYEKLGLVDKTQYDESTSYMPPEVYQEGLNEEQEEKWEQLLDIKGRTPYIEYPNVCAKCGCIYPKLFSVANDEWKKYIQMDMRDSIICLDCFTFIKDSIDKNAAK